MTKSNIDYICLFSNASNTIVGNLLHRDFKHCLIVLRRCDEWIYIDPLRSVLIKQNFGNVTAANIAELYIKRNYRIVCGQRCRKHVNKKSHIQMLDRTCVSICKRFIGVEASTVITPYQLYWHLLRNGKGKALS